MTATWAGGVYMDGRVSTRCHVGPRCRWEAVWGGGFGVAGSTGPW